MFTPTGSKLGGEVLVNQFTANNQRTPTVAALPDGRFVIPPVSEQERPIHGCQQRFAERGCLCARISIPQGGGVGNEILVNASDKICAAPDFTSAPDGGFMATWMEKDLAVRNNGWDIFARRFTSVGVGGNVTRVNTQLYGDQYSPKLRRAGSTYLDIWASIEQDGSREGVFGQYLNDDATVSGQ